MEELAPPQQMFLGHDLPTHPPRLYVAAEAPAHLYTLASPHNPTPATPLALALFLQVLAQLTLTTQQRALGSLQK